MKRKFISIAIIVGIFFTNTLSVHANMDFMGMNDFSNPAMDFSMDMIMDQGLMSMQGADDMIIQAEETNFMNHEMDNTLSFFFDDLPQYHEETVFFAEDNIIQDAFADGSWSDSFNDHFNVDSGLLFPEIDFVTEVSVDSPQGIDSSDITFDDSMPSPSTNDSGGDDFPQENNLSDHSDIVNQIENNTMPDEMPMPSVDDFPTLPEVEQDNGLNSAPEPELEDSSNTDNDIPSNSSDISSIEVSN